MSQSALDLFFESARSKARKMARTRRDGVSNQDFNSLPPSMAYQDPIHPPNGMEYQYPNHASEPYPNVRQSSMGFNQSSGQDAHIIDLPFYTDPPSYGALHGWLSAEDAQLAFGNVGSMSDAFASYQMTLGVGEPRQAGAPMQDLALFCCEPEPYTTSSQPPREPDEVRQNSLGTNTTGSMDENRFCVHCKTSFSRPTDLRRHNRSRGHVERAGSSDGQPNSLESYPCPVCKACYTRNDNMMRHQKKKGCSI
ncbi:hypothetical protein SCAR479_12601 [Seiridium cardinale]|uniref:C2H2-type domain-containing protein n=1 Tax=Seiridium cardinale TaxID=138064 RepID=A0ABR2XAC7_9PEZI